jgi:hypothetical protein
MIRVWSLLLFELIVSIKYLGGDGDYSYDNPGNSITECLSDNDHICFVKNAIAKAFGSITLSSNDTPYTIGSVKPVPQNYYELEMQNWFTFRVEKGSTCNLEDLYVFFLILFEVLF